MNIVAKIEFDANDWSEKVTLCIRKVEADKAAAAPAQFILLYVDGFLASGEETATFPTLAEAMNAAAAEVAEVEDSI